MTTERKLSNEPSSTEVWVGIGGHFDSLGQILAEFVDNAVANIMAKNPPNRDVQIRLIEREQTVFVSVEDTGSGIADLDNAFTLGGKADRQGPLNEHGFGMKHALASANPDNDNWAVHTRTANHRRGEYDAIRAPYELSGQLARTLDVADEPWPGLYNGTGTLVQFECSRAMFDTLGARVPGPRAQFDGMIGHLVEFLGYIYSGLIQANAASFQVVSQARGGEPRSQRIPAVIPSWIQFYPPGTGQEAFDLGNGTVKLKYQLGAIKDSEYRRYYRTNTRCSGLEIRQNGRLIENNIFTEVWGKEPHNMYNHILVIVDIVSDVPERLPFTRSSKNGYRQGDPRLIAVYDWVRRHMPELPKDIGYAVDETDLFDELKNHKNLHVPDPKTVEREQKLFTSLGETKIRADLYLAYGKQLHLYEGKKDSTTVKDVYQLRMYWDGAIQDGLIPTRGILIASEHPKSVLEVLALTNTLRDAAGDLYVFQAKTWRDEGIQFPR